MPQPPKVEHGLKNPTDDFRLSDGRVAYGFRYYNGSPDGGLTDVSQSPSTLKFSGGGGKYGDWDPSMSHIEQRSWIGGRGSEDFSNDASRFNDSMAAWTLTDSWLYPAPKWKMGRGLVTDVCNLPGDIEWIGVTGSNRYVSLSFSFTAETDIDRCYLWLRRVGSPADLTVSLFSDDSGDPDTSIADATVGIDTITDVISEFHAFLFGTQTCAISTDYHIVITGAATDSGQNHWEIATDADGAGSQRSSDGSTWAAATYTFYHRIMKLGVQRKFRQFHSYGGLYVVDERDDQSASKVYLNGWRGKATSVTSEVYTGAGVVEYESYTRLTDTNLSLTEDIAIGTVIYIVSGTGKGQRSTILDNDTNSFVFQDMGKTPDTTSVYVIQGSEWWFELETTGITGVVKSVCVYNNTAMFAQGADINIRKMKYDPTTNAHVYADDGTNKADLVYTFYDATREVVIYKLLNSTVKEMSAPVVAWGTAFTFANEKAVGDGTNQVNSFSDYDEVLWAIKEDSVWRKSSGGTWTKLNVGLEALPSTTNGLGVASQNMYFYFSWALSVERLYGGATSNSGTLDDVGPWKGSGMPEARRGVVSCLLPIIGWLFAGVDAGKNKTSSVLIYNGIGWHEVFRAWEAGRRVRNLFWEPVQSTQPFLWISVGEDLVYQNYPDDSLNLLQDSGIEYQHESTVVSAMVDLGASQLPKFFKEFTLQTENANNEIEVGCDIQTDQEINGSTWAEIGTFLTSPEAVLPVFRGDKRRIVTRLRMRTDIANTPPKIRATVLESFGRIPEKRQWNVTVSASAYGVNLRGAPTATPSEVYSWLQSKVRSASGLIMRSLIKEMDDVYVIIDHVVPVRKSVDKQLGEWSGYIQMTIREA